MEAELQQYLDTYESTHDYDEYHFDLDDIEHDPYVLISAVTALMGREWTLSEVGGILDRRHHQQRPQAAHRNSAGGAGQGGLFHFPDGAGCGLPPRTEEALRAGKAQGKDAGAVEE